MIDRLKEMMENTFGSDFDKKCYICKSVDNLIHIKDFHTNKFTNYMICEYCNDKQKDDYEE